MVACSAQEGARPSRAAQITWVLIPNMPMQAREDQECKATVPIFTVTGLEPGEDNIQPRGRVCQRREANGKAEANMATKPCQMLVGLDGIKLATVPCHQATKEWGGPTPHTHHNGKILMEWAWDMPI